MRKSKSRSSSRSWSPNDEVSDRTASDNGGGSSSRNTTPTREADDEQSYHTQYSAGSMGLSKRPNKKLSLVTYVAMTQQQQQEEEDRQSENGGGDGGLESENDNGTTDGNSSLGTNTINGNGEERYPPPDIDKQDPSVATITASVITNNVPVMEDVEEDSVRIQQRTAVPFSESGRRRSPKAAAKTTATTTTTTSSSPNNTDAMKNDNGSPRRGRGYKTFQEYKAANIDSAAKVAAAVAAAAKTKSDSSSFDHSSSTHKARGATTATTSAPWVSTSTSSSSSHWRRPKPELSVITDVKDEEDSSQEQPAEIPLKLRPTAEDLSTMAGTAQDEGDPSITTPDASSATVVDGAETRSRRRERLTRLARIKSKSPAQKDRTPTPRRTDHNSPDHSPVRKEDDIILDQSSHVGPPSQVAPRGSGPRKPFFAEEAPVEEPNPSQDQHQTHHQPFMEKFLKKYHAKKHVVKSSTERDFARSTSRSKNDNISHSDPYDDSPAKDRYSATPNEYKMTHDPHSETLHEYKATTRNHYYSKPTNEYKASYDPYSNEPEEYNTTEGYSKVQTKYNTGSRAPNKYKMQNVSSQMEQRSSEGHNAQVPVNVPFDADPQEDHTSIDEAASLNQYDGQYPFTGKTPQRRELSTVREESRGTSVGPDSVTGSRSENSSVVTSNLQQDPPCISQFIQNARFLTRDSDGNGCVGYTQKCTSFVRGVWQSCGINGYQTESKKGLLQLEMIAEQSVSSIYQTSKVGRQSPDAFRHSRELMEKAKEEGNKELNEMRSDDATHENLHRQPFQWNMEETLSHIGAKVQQAVGLNEDGRQDEQSVLDDMRHIFDSFSTYYNPHHQPYYGDAGPSPVKERVFDYRHGATNVDGGGGGRLKRSTQSAVSPTSAGTATLASDQQDEPSINAPTEEDEGEYGRRTCEDTAENASSMAIYQSVVGGNRDRRGMFIELQKRRMKQPKRHDDSWTDRKTEDETARLRRLYLGLYDKIHDEANAKPVRQPKEENVSTMEIEEIPEELEDDLAPPDGRDDTFSEPSRIRTEAVVEERDYAVVWAASDASMTSPRASRTFQAEGGCLFDNDRELNEDGSHSRDEDNNENDDSEPLGWPGQSDNEKNTAPEPILEEAMLPKIPSVAEPEPLDSLLAEHGSLVDCISGTQSHEKSDIDDCTVENEKSTSTRYLDAEEYQYSAGREHGGTSMEDAGERMFLAHPDPTVSDEDTKAESPKPDTSEESGKGSSEEGDSVEAALQSSDTSGSATTSEMDDLVTSFLDGATGGKTKDTIDANVATTRNKAPETGGLPPKPPSPSPNRPNPVGMSSNLRDYDGSSDSSRSMVLLTEDTFLRRNASSFESQSSDTAIPDESLMPIQSSLLMDASLPVNAPLPTNIPWHVDEEGDKKTQGHEEEVAILPEAPTIQATPDNDSMSYTSGDPTLADSTMNSGFSGSSHTQDLSLAETIVSVGPNNNQSRSSRTYSSSSTNTSDVSSHGSPEPSDVPPEIAQPRGPISEYQVLYQISEEDEEGATSSDEPSSSNDHSDDDAASVASFEPQNDIPFDEDVSLEDYRRKQSTLGFLLTSASLWRWVVLAGLAHYFGIIEWILDTSNVASMVPSVVIPDHGFFVPQRVAPQVVVDKMTPPDKPQKANAKSPPVSGITTTSSSFRAEEYSEDIVQDQSEKGVSDDIDDTIVDDNVYDDDDDYYYDGPIYTHSRPNGLGEEIVEVPLYDGISVWKGLDGDEFCTSLAFVTGSTSPVTESEAFLRAWALELQDALKDFEY